MPRASSSSRWALRLSPKSESWRPLVVAGLVALALLGVGEAAPAAFPIQVTIEGHGAALTVTADGEQHTFGSQLGPGWTGVGLDEPGPLQREYQVDGSDTTSSDDRQPRTLIPLLDSPLYRFDAWLRDESSYSRWQHLLVTEPSSRQPIASGSGGLPTDFRVDAALQRPESAATLWLIGPADNQREGLQMARDQRIARWVVQRGGQSETLTRWFFPEQPAPFAADLLQLLGRSAAAGFSLGLAAVLCGGLLTMLVTRVRVPVGLRAFQSPFPAGAFGTTLSVEKMVLVSGFLSTAIIATTVFHQLPHVLDAVSYRFQAGLFASGQIALATPPLVNAFKGPFGVNWHGLLFSQYPPGAPALYAIGELLHVEWLVGPLACLALVGCSAWTAEALFGRSCGVVVLFLGVISPFVLFQAGSFLSHPLAGGLLAGGLASFVAGERSGRDRWYACAGLLIGASFVTREAASLLFALPLGLRLIATRRWRALTLLVTYGTPFLLMYLVYNTRLTGSPVLLPRMIFDPADHFGFGDGVGFYGRHTLAAGLANTDELLTLLQFDLFGWPPLFALGLLGVPFLFNRFRSWDVVAAGGLLAVVVTYTGFYYHGIALGPRYYFEAMPWLLLLAGRGAQVLARMGSGCRAAVAVLLGLLCLNTLFFYLPSEIQRRADYSGMPANRKIVLPFVESSLFGPRLSGVANQSLVVTDDWWLYNTALAALNCPTLPYCDVLFALAPRASDVTALRAQFPERTLLRTVDAAGRIELVPAGSAP